MGLEANKWGEWDKRKVTLKPLHLFYGLSSANTAFLTSWPWRASEANSSLCFSYFRMHIFKGSKKQQAGVLRSCFSHVAPIKRAAAHGCCSQRGRRCSRGSQETLQRARKRRRRKVSKPLAVAESPNNFRRAPRHPSSLRSLFLRGTGEQIRLHLTFSSGRWNSNSL